MNRLDPRFLNVSNAFEDFWEDYRCNLKPTLRLAPSAEFLEECRKNETNGMPPVQIKEDIPEEVPARGIFLGALLGALVWGVGFSIVQAVRHWPWR